MRRIAPLAVLALAISVIVVDRVPVEEPSHLSKTAEASWERCYNYDQYGLGSACDRYRREHCVGEYRKSGCVLTVKTARRREWKNR